MLMDVWKALHGGTRSTEAELREPLVQLGLYTKFHPG